MRFFKNIFDFYIESSLHVAFAVYALIRVTFFKLNILYDEPVAYFGLYGTIVGYNFIKYDELARIKKVELTNNFKFIIGLSVLAVFAAGYYFLELKTNTKLIGLGALFLTVLYTLPFFPNRKNMRNWSGLKIYLVALTWIGVTVLLPVINAEVDFSIVTVLVCLQRFIFVFILMLIFEIIDLQFDDKELKTIPQKVGITKTKQLAYILLVVFAGMDFFKPNISLKQLVLTITITFIIGLLTFFSNDKRNKYYSSFWVESVPIIWLLLLIFTEKI